MAMMDRFRACSLCGQAECVHIITEDMTLWGKTKFWGGWALTALAAVVLFFLCNAIEYYTGYPWWGAAMAIMTILAALS